MYNRPFDYDAIKKEIQESPENSAVYIGADSKVYTEKGTQMVMFVTVIILHLGSSKGAKLFKAFRTERHFGQMRVRLMTEVFDAAAAAMEISDVLEDRSLEIHLDINTDERYASSVVMREAKGYIMGTLGFDPKLKPDAYAASHVADRWAVKTAKRQSDSPAEKRRFRKELERKYGKRA